MGTVAPPPGHAARARGSAGVVGGASRARARSRAVRRSVADLPGLTFASTRSSPVGPPFFWPAWAQQVASAARAFPFRDVSAAVAGAGAFALWALALSLLAV